MSAAPRPPAPRVRPPVRSSPVQSSPCLCPCLCPCPSVAAAYCSLSISRPPRLLARSFCAWVPFASPCLCLYRSFDRSARRAVVRFPLSFLFFPFLSFSFYVFLFLLDDCAVIYISARERSLFRPRPVLLFVRLPLGSRSRSPFPSSLFCFCFSFFWCWFLRLRVPALAPAFFFFSFLSFPFLHFLFSLSFHFSLPHFLSFSPSLATVRVTHTGIHTHIQHTSAFSPSRVFLLLRRRRLRLL